MKAGRSDAASTALALVLLAWAVSDRVQKLRGRPTFSVDFYQYWVVGKAAADAPAGDNPYSQASGARLSVQALAASRATGPGSARALVAAQRANLEIFSTPFLYALFSVPPGEYEAAFLAYSLFASACLA